MYVLVNAYVHSSNDRPTARWWFAGFFTTGNTDFSWDHGVVLTPSTGAEFSATPALPCPRSSISCRNVPPAE